MTDTERYEYIIYKICSDECGEFYIGSTRNMVQRKKNHKTVCNNPNSSAHNTKIYRTIRDNGGWDAFRMVPLEKMENTTKFEAECREEVVRTNLQAKMNSQRASCGGITREEYGKRYKEEHKEHYKEIGKIYNKQYYQKKKEKFNQNFVCNCGGKYTHINKTKHLKTQKHQLYLDNLENET